MLRGFRDLQFHEISPERSDPRQRLGDGSRVETSDRSHVPALLSDPLGDGPVRWSPFTISDLKCFKFKFVTENLFTCANMESYNIRSSVP